MRAEPSTPASVVVALAVALILCLAALAVAGSQSGKNPLMPEIPTVTSEFIFTQAPFEQCHASTLVELPPGDVLAAWFGGRREGEPSVAIWGAMRRHGAWSAPRELAREPGVPCWNPVLFRD